MLRCDPVANDSDRFSKLLFASDCSDDEANEDKDSTEGCGRDRMSDDCDVEPRRSLDRIESEN